MSGFSGIRVRCRKARAVRASGRREGVHTHVGCSLFAAGCASILSLPPDIILNRATNSHKHDEREQVCVCV